MCCGIKVYVVLYRINEEHEQKKLMEKNLYLMQSAHLQLK